MGNVRIYVEGNSRKYHHDLREGFRSFLTELLEAVRPQWGIKIIMCGSRWGAFDDFKEAIGLYENDFCVLMIDSERPFTSGNQWGHLRSFESWPFDNWDNNRCYLMTQIMEAWFFADIDTVESYYGQHFRRNAMGNTANIETIPKQQLEERLKAATKDTQKGEYSKGKHSGAILRLINPDNVRARSPQCNRMFTEIPAALQSL